MLDYPPNRIAKVSEILKLARPVLIFISHTQDKLSEYQYSEDRYTGPNS